MGLDMSLYRVKKMKNRTLEEILELNEKMYEDELTGKELVEIEPYVIKNDYGNTLLDEVMYWRKVNAIHRWFVDNVQGGKDDCHNYPITEKDIEILLDTVTTVYNSLKDKERVTQIFKDYDNKPYEDKCYMPQDLTVAKELLPTQEGFFFGGTNYNEYYFDMIVETMDKCREIIDTFDFENNYLFYNSSW